MKLNAINKKIIKEIIYDYKNKNIDLSFIFDIKRIIESENDKVNIVINNNNENSYTDMDTGIIYINLDYLNEYSKYISNNHYTNDIKNKQMLYNMYSLITLFHEYVHTEQFKLMYEGKYELKKLYNDIMNANEFGQLAYLIKSAEFCHERNANIDAYENVLYLANEDEINEYFKRMYLCNLTSFYDEDGYNPVKHTYNLLLKDCDIDISNLSFKERLIHGFSITSSEYEELLKEFKGKSSFKEVDEKKIIKLIRG